MDVKGLYEVLRALFKADQNFRISVAQNMKMCDYFEQFEMKFCVHCDLQALNIVVCIVKKIINSLIVKGHLNFVYAVL